VNRRSLGPAALAASAALLLLLTACGSVSPYAARVDGQSISQKDLEGEMRAIAANEAYVAQIESRLPVRGSGAGTFDAVFTAQVLGRQVQYVLVEREIERRQIRVTEADLQGVRTEVAAQAGGEEVFNGFSADYQRTLVERAAKVDALTVALTGQKAGEEAYRAFFEANRDEFAEACVSHILVTSQDRAAELKARLDGGESFGAVARADSQDTQSAAQDGDLGCNITTESYAGAPELTRVIFEQPVGEVAGPVQTQFGFHVVLVRSRTVPTYEQASTRARQQVVAAGLNMLQEWITAAVAEADIEVNPRYGTFDKQALTVTPPTLPSTTVPDSPPVSGIQPLNP
jgi:parvulin-like peptidyl-prolyl isomerase